MFTFLIVSYNEEKFVTQTLESVKYQVIHYAKEEQVQLIIADDGSKDGTRKNIDAWLEKNGTLFADVVKIYQQENVGTSRNFVDAIRCVQGDYIISIAGDDLFPETDLFSLIHENEDADIISGGILMFSDDKIIDQGAYYKDVFAQDIRNHRYLCWAMKLGCPIQVGAIWKRSLVTEEDLEYTEKFKLLEDRSRYYRIAEYHKGFTYRYINKPILLYRKSGNSVSSSNNYYLKMLNRDMAYLYWCEARECKRPLLKFTMLCQFWAVHLRGNKKAGILRYMTPYFFVEQMRRWVLSRRFAKARDEFMLKYKSKNQIYLMKIQSVNETL